jgi:sulfide:quinone oxidoreductase
MKKHVVILGAGFAGLELAARLSESLVDEVDVTLIDQNDSFYFGFAKLAVMLGHKPASAVRMYYRDIAKPGVEFRQETITAIDPDKRSVTTDRGSYDADFLVVALGARYDFAATPGLEDGGYEYYSLAGAERLCDAIAEFESGTVLISVLGHPFKCPPAPFEGAFLIHHHFAERGIRHQTEIRMTFPMEGPVPVTPEVSQLFKAALDEREIHYEPQRMVQSIDPEERAAHLTDGGTLRYDMFIGIPVHRVPGVVERSGLAPDGWISVDKTNLTTGFPDVYALGDVAGLPMAKAGVFAEAAARVVADDIAARLTGSDPPPPFAGAGNCYVDFGGGLVGKVEANFLSGPRPTARLIEPSRETAAEKESFGPARRARWFGA